MDSEETMAFSALANVRPRVETFKLEHAEQALAKVLDNKVRFRAVLVPSSDNRLRHRCMTGRWIEDGLFYSGPTPPAGVGRASDWVELPHETYLPIPKSRLEAAMRAHPRAAGAGVAFEHFLRLLDGLLHFHHHETLNRLKQDYLLFSPEDGAAARAGAAPERQREAGQAVAGKVGDTGADAAADPGRDLARGRRKVARAGQQDGAEAVGERVVA